MTVSNDLIEAGKASKRLCELDDQLREVLKTIEVSLRKHLSVRVSTKFSDEYTLTFGKINGGWRLIMTSIEGDDEIDEVLEQMPRDIRSEVMSGGHVERLVREAIGHIDGMIADRELAIKKADDLLAALSVPAAETPSK